MCDMKIFKPTFFISMCLTLAIMLTSFGVHEYYITICNVEHINTDQRLEISIKFIAHDLEADILQQTGESIKLDQKNDQIDSVLNRYITDHLSISNNKKDIVLIYIGFEFSLDEECMVYFESEQVKEPKKLEITNTLLVNTFKEQENIVNVTIDEQTLQHSYNKNITNHIFNIDE